MSKFVTSIAVDVEGVKKLLPGKAFLSEVRFNKEASTVEVVWEDDKLVTPFTNATEFSLEALREKKLPAGVKLRSALQKAKPAATPMVTTRAKVLVKKPVSKTRQAQRVDRTEEQGKGDKASEGVGESEAVKNVDEIAS